MPIPSFKPTEERILVVAGLQRGSSLYDIPVSAQLTARLDLADRNALDIKVKMIKVFAQIRAGTIPSGNDQPPGTPPTPDIVLYDYELLRQSDGVTPVTANPGEIVEIDFDAVGTGLDFDEVHGQLVVMSDNWDRISISYRFIANRDVQPAVPMVSAIVRRGRTAVVKLPVRWAFGPPSDVYCSLSSPSLASGELISVHSEIEVTSPLARVLPGETKDVTFSIEVGRECPIGFWQLGANLVVYGMHINSFEFDLHVLPPPAPPPPSNDYEYRIVGPYFIKRKGNKLSVQREDEDEPLATASVPPGKLSEQQSDAVLDRTGSDIREYFARNIDGITSGRITAAEIGGAVYYITTVAAVSVVLVSLGLAPLAPVVVPAAGRVGRNVGEFYGSIVDDVVAILKREEKPTVYEAVGTLGTVYFTVISPIVPIAGAAKFLGADGWSLTRQVGKRIGRELEAEVNAIESIVSDIGGGIEDVGDAFGDAAAWVEDIFGL